MNERLNIRRMNILEEKGEPEWFDPSTEITASDWGAMEIERTEYRTMDDSLFDPVEWLVEMTAYMNIIDPNGPQRLVESEVEHMQERIDVARSKNEWGDFLAIAAHFKMANPTWDPNITPFEVNDIAQDISAWGDMGPGKITQLAEARILDPKTSFVRPDEIKDIEQAVQTQYEVRTVDTNITDKFSSWEYFIDRASDARIISSDIQVPKLNAEDWRTMRAMLREHMKEGRPKAFARYAARMKILAAKSVEVTEKGIVLTMPEKKTFEKNHPQPETPLL